MTEVVSVKKIVKNHNLVISFDRLSNEQYIFSGKFIHVTDKKTGRQYIVAVSEDIQDYHKNIYHNFKEKEGIDELEIHGGAWFYIREDFDEEDCIQIYGTSIDYGCVDTEFIISVLKDAFPEEIIKPYTFSRL